MHKKTLLLAITASFLLNACDDTFTVDETKYKGNIDTENNKEVSEGCEHIQYIEYTQKNTNTKITVNKDTYANENWDRNNLPDLSWNFKHGICPPIAPHRVYISEQDDTCYCSDKVITNACKNGEVMYENDENGVCISKTCENGLWKSDGNNQCSGNVSCKVEKGTTTGCGECQNSAQKCEEDAEGNGSIYTCVDGKWSDKKIDCKADATHKASCLDDTKCASCIENALQYDNNEGLCIHQKCQNGSWVNTTDNQCPSNVSCKQEDGINVCGECKTGAQKCEEDAEGNGSIYTCVDGKWSDNKIDCMVDATHRTSCLNENQCATCLENEFRRINNNDELCTPQICINHEWIDEPVQEELGYPLHQCTSKVEGNTVPVAVSCKQEDDQYTCGECMNFDTKCTNIINNNKFEGFLETCNSGVWANKTACIINKKPVSCDTMKDECGVCQDGETKYENIYDANGMAICKVLICSAGQWIEQPHSDCGNISCKLDENENKVCGDCINGSLRCIEDSLNNGEVQRCINGIWQPQSKCKYNEESTQCNHNQDLPTACAECVENSIDYRNNEDGQCEKWNCLNGYWSKDDNYTCKYACRNDTNEQCAACTDNTFKCENRNNTYQYLQCIGGIWTPIFDCPHQNCKLENGQSTQCGECKNGDSKYTENNNLCLHFICKDGDWIEAEKGPTDPIANVSCSINATGEMTFGECINGHTECNNNTLKTCIHGKYEFIECKYCDNGNENESAHCINNSCDEPYSICDKGVLTKCENNLQIIEYCQLGKCANETECANCTANICTTKDNSEIGQIRICNESNLLAPQIDCENRTSCNSEGNACGICENNTTNCVEDADKNAIQYICINGSWEFQKNCGKNSCNDNKCGECANGITRCINDNNNNGQRQECQNGIWINGVQCKDSSCTKDGICGDCIDNKYQCTHSTEESPNDVVNKCRNGKWIPVSECYDTSCHNINDDQIVCGECKNGSTKYDQGAEQICQYFICNNGEWKLNQTCPDNVSCKQENDSWICGECHNFEIFEKGSTTHKITTCLDGTKHDTKCTYVWYEVGYVKTIGDYGVCRDSEDDNILCYMDNNIGYNRSNNKPCNTSNGQQVSCTVSQKATTACGNCINGNHRCKNDQTRQTCVNGTWGFDETCDGSCSDGECQSSDIL